MKYIINREKGQKEIYSDRDMNILREGEGMR